MGTRPSPLPVLLGALALDYFVKEPPLWAHPVMAIGWVGDKIEHHIFKPGQPLPIPVSRGAIGWALGLVACTSAGVLAQKTPRPMQALALWTLFSHKMLIEEVAKVEQALDESVEAGRTQVAMLVSRPTQTLDAPKIRAAAIESLTENLSDSVTAPLLFWAVGDLPGVAAYRWMNTADARFGYRDTTWEHLGKVSAKMDDLANLIPARLTGVLLAGTSTTLQALRTEAKRTSSPNAGWPMGAIALALGIQLEKVGVYTLNPKGRLPMRGDIGRAIKRVNKAHVAIGIGCALLARLRGASWR